MFVIGPVINTLLKGPGSFFEPRSDTVKIPTFYFKFNGVIFTVLSVKKIVILINIF